MVDLGLLAVLLPEALAMIEARDRGAGDFSGILPTLDQMIVEERELSDVVLLAAVLLPRVMLRRFEVETRRQRLMEMAEYRKTVREVLDGFLERFQIANFKRALIVQALEGFHRLCGHRWTPAQRRRFVGKSYFDDALALFEILVIATGEGHEALEQWVAAAGRRPKKKAEVRRRPQSGRSQGGRSPGGRPPDRPRRRRRRRK
jgi:hypothetical protein